MGGGSSSSGGSSIGPGSLSGGSTAGTEGSAPTVHALTDTVTMRYYSKSEMAPAMLKVMLAKFAGVSKVKVTADDMRVSFQFAGSYPALLNIEKSMARTNAPVALVSHGYILLAVRAKKGSDEDALKRQLRQVPGVKYVCCLNGGVVCDLFADVSKLDFARLVEVAGENNYRAQVKSHETVTLTVEGDDIDTFFQKLFHHKTKKVLMAAKEDGKITLRCMKSLSDSVLKQLARACKVKVTKIERN